MNKLVIEVGERPGRGGYAWVLDGRDPYIVCSGSNYWEALGHLMMYLSCNEPLERTGIDLTLVDKVPDSVLKIESVI